MRFEEEKRFFSEMAERAQAKNWKKAALTAKLHISSRLHAALLLPRVLSSKNWQGAQKLSRHVIG